MNLFGIAHSAVAVINPHRYATIKRSNGYTVDATGRQVPAYITVPNVLVQVQALSNDELHMLEGLNLQGNKCAVYLYGDFAGLVRKTGQGGDLFILDGATWLATIVLENWGAPDCPDGWVKLALTQQTDR